MLVVLMSIVILTQQQVNGGILKSNSVIDESSHKTILDSVKCKQQLTFLANHSLALKFFDSSGKLPSSILKGNLQDLGDYYQCLSIDEAIDEMHIEGKYCMVSFPLKQDPIQIAKVPGAPGLYWPETDEEAARVFENYTRLNYVTSAAIGLVENSNEIPVTTTPGATALAFKLAICIPKVCSPSQATDFVQNIFRIFNLTYTETLCRFSNDKQVSAADYVAIVIFSMIGLITIISTAYDLHHTFVSDKGFVNNRLLTSFSVYTNTRRFLTFTRSSDGGSLDCLDGIRSISMLWVVVGHTFAVTVLSPVRNIADILLWTQKYSSVWITSAPITVDTFFLLSGILCVYTTIGKYSRSTLLKNIHLFYLHRYLRIFPLLATMVLLQASLINHFSDGPMWKLVGSATDNCRRRWWTTLLHVQNYVHNTSFCLAPTWYLSVDMQLYIFCPLILFCLFGRSRRAWWALATIVFLSLVSSTVYSFYYNFSAGLNLSRAAEIVMYMKKYYFNTLTRAPPFFIGMVYGYLLHIWTNRIIHIPKLINLLLWSLAFAIMSFCIFSMYPVMQADHDAQMFDNFLNAYMRAVWAVALGWLIFACVHGYGGPINWFLSLSVWKLPARLSYAMYLVHYPLIMVANASWVDTHYFTEGDAIYRFMSDITTTFWASFVLSIAIDAPATTLLKLMFSEERRAPKNRNGESREAIVERRTDISSTDAAT